MKKIHTILGVLFTILTIFSCDQIDDPIPAEATVAFSLGGDVEFIPDADLGLTDTSLLKEFIISNSWDTSIAADNSTIRNIVLEEFTGHTCASCPKGTREITRLKGLYGKQLIPVGIHTGFFARPSPPNYTTDFRVGDDSDGAQYVAAFDVEGNPRGIVSRIGKANSESSWQSDINALKDLSPDASLGLTTYYDSTINVVRAEVKVDWNSTIAGNYNLQLYVIEGNIIDWQLDGSVDNPNYVHKFVLRKIVNGTFGKLLETSEVGKSQTIQYIFSVDQEWKGKEMEVVAFVFNNDANAYETIQANSTYLIKK